MTIRSFIRQTGGLLSTACLLGLFLVPACKADAPPALAAVTKDPAAAHLEHLAEAGRFDEVLARLKNDYPDLRAAAVTDLIEDLDRFDQNQEQLHAQRRTAYKEAVVKVRTELDADRIEEALIAAIDAHGLAEAPPELLLHPNVQEAVARGHEAAQQAVQDHDWVRALTLYRAMDLLFDDYATYRDDVKRVAKHLKVLQLYNPDQLRALYKAQADRKAEDGGDDDERPDLIVEAESWETRLRDIDVSMLRTTFAQAARQHVESDGYAPLMRGALESLLIMLSTEHLDQTFPSFQDDQNLNAFRDGVSAMLARIDGPDVSLSFLEAAGMIENVLKLNRSTLDLPQQVVVYELGEGATSTLDDFTAVIWPYDLDQFKRSTQGTFYGVGIQIKRENNQLTVVTPLPGTPAMDAGIQAGDVIATVDGKDTSVWSLDKAVREITGPEGTPVVLGIQRSGREGIREHTIRRAEIEIESIRGWSHTDDGGWDYWIDADRRIGYIRLSQFIPQTADDMDEAVQQMQKDGPINGLILDLRFNPGGLLSSAIDVVDRFVHEGPIVSTVNAKGDKTNESRARGRLTYKHFPVVVLINQGSASASEIVAGALQDYGRALIVGSRSFGKGSVQDLFPLGQPQGKAYLKLTTQYYMLPLGRIIHRKPDAVTWGVEPDLAIEMTNKQMADALEYRQEVDILRDNSQLIEGDEPPTAQAILDDGVDPQLTASLLVLKTRLIAQDIAIAQARAEAPSR